MNKAAMMVLSIVATAPVWAATEDRAWAHDRVHGHDGFYLGSPWVWGPYPYYPPVPVYPQPRVRLVVQAAPQIDVRQTPGDWYYCADSGSYSPYVQTCPSGWMRGVPQDRTLQ